VKRAAALLALALGSSACSVLLGLDEAEFDPSLERSGDGGDDGGAANASGGASAGSAGEIVADSAGAGGASE
jgi:hypothetical protein